MAPATRRAWAKIGVSLSAIIVVPLLMGPLSCRKKDDAPGPSVKTVVDAAGVDMVLVPAGEFRMGSDDREDDEKPAHKVRLSAFYMDRTEVTQKSYESLMGINPSRFKGPDRPVESLAWSAAAKYCNLRSQKEGLAPCYDLKTLACDLAAGGYRLPTEAEWEYACRAGSAGEYCYGSDPAALDEWAWTKENSQGTTHPVGQKKANAWGLHDMHGNVAEWCNDYYGPKEYSASDATDPRGPAKGDYRVMRGGSWRSGATVCRSAARTGEAPGVGDVCLGYEAFGFRCVRKAGE